MSVDHSPRGPGRLFTRRRALLAAGTLGAVAAGAPGLARALKGPLWRRERLASLTSAHVDAVRRDPDAVRDVYAACRTDLAALLGAPFADLPAEDLALIFCSLLANALAPYGESNATSLTEMLDARTLNCGNYPFLMIRLHERLGPPADPPVSLVGWTGGYFGDHSLAYRAHPDPGRCLFLDPTAALVARATFDDVVSGRPVPADRLVCFAYREAEVPFALWIAKAFAKGRLKPSDLLYYFESLDHQLTRYGEPNIWPTPGAARWRAARPAPS